MTPFLYRYDLWQLDQRRNNQLFALAVMAFMHLKLKYTTPLLMNIASTICSILEDPMVTVFLRGKEPVGDLARPWASSDPLDAIAGGPMGGDPQASAPPAQPQREGEGEGDAKGKKGKDKNA